MYMGLCLGIPQHDGFPFGLHLKPTRKGVPSKSKTHIRQDESRCHDYSRHKTHGKLRQLSPSRSNLHPEPSRMEIPQQRGRKYTGSTKQYLCTSLWVCLFGVPLLGWFLRRKATIFRGPLKQGRLICGTFLAAHTSGEQKRAFIKVG